VATSPPGHPLHGKDYGEVEAEVHGGWWLGFDCAHYGDLSPGFTNGLRRDGVYRDMEFVTREVEQLAEQFQRQAA